MNDTLHLHETVKDLLYSLTGITLTENKDIMISNRLHKLKRNAKFTGSVDELLNTINMEVYPNPATDMANISFSVKDAGVAKIEILNAVGQVIVSQDLGTISGQQNISMNTADLASGMYIVRISVGENITTRSLSISNI